MAKRILVVDDEKDMRTYISTLLSTAGYKVDEAVNGPEGLKKLQEKKPDLVTLDMMMPQESGVKLYRDIKTSDQFRDIPVLVISGLAKKTFLHSQKVLDKFKGQQVPEPEAYIEKPAEPDELLAEVQRLLPS